jgi:5-methylcytosine-specific restriction protein A
VLELKRACEFPYCGKYASAGGYCDEHAERRAARATRQAQGYDETWLAFRRNYLREHPLCRVCANDGRVTAATDIHHERKLRDYPALKYEESNLVACCHSCHSRITRANAKQVKQGD